MILCFRCSPIWCAWWSDGWAAWVTQPEWQRHEGWSQEARRASNYKSGPGGLPRLLVMPFDNVWMQQSWWQRVASIDASLLLTECHRKTGPNSVQPKTFHWKTIEVLNIFLEPPDCYCHWEELTNCVSKRHHAHGPSRKQFIRYIITISNSFVQL